MHILSEQRTRTSNQLIVATTVAVIVVIVLITLSIFTDERGDDNLTETPSVPMASFFTRLNVRSGPGINFYPPIGQFTEGQSTEILGTNLDGSWLKVYFGIGEGWVYASPVNIKGDISDLPREIGPPTPAPTHTSES